MRPLSTWRAVNRSLGGGAFLPPRILGQHLRHESTIQSTGSTIKQYAADAERAARDSSRSKKLLYFAAGTIVLGAGAYAVSDDARHIYNAVQRAGRVGSTLFVCINEYVLSHECLRCAC